MSTPKAVSDYMREMQRRSAAARKANLSPAEMSAKMKAIRAAAKKKRSKTKARALRQNAELCHGSEPLASAIGSGAVSTTYEPRKNK